MFSVTEAEATAIRDAFHQRGELSAVIELRRLFPGVTDKSAGSGVRPHYCRLGAVRAGSAAAIVAACQNQHIVNLLLVLMVLAIWFLMNPRGLFTSPLPERWRARRG